MSKNQAKPQVTEETVDRDGIVLTKAKSLIDMLCYPRRSKHIDDEIYQEFLKKFIEPIMGKPDEHGNYILIIKDDLGDIPEIAYMSHHDTVDRSFIIKTNKFAYKPSNSKSPALLFGIKNTPRINVITKSTQTNKDTGEVLKETSVETVMNDPSFLRPDCLGADCTTGVWLMLEMIEAQVPGVYVIHSDEECGRLGSEAIVKDFYDSDGKKYSWLDYINIAISFDRKDVDSIITYQSGSRCCSEDFSDSLSDLLSPDLIEGGYKKLKSDTGGSYTDSYSYMNIIPECTNLSVGYYKQHSSSEEQDLAFAIVLRDALIKHGNTLADRKTISVSRDPSVTESLYKQSNNYASEYYGGYGHNSGYKPKGNNNVTSINNHGKGAPAKPVNSHTSTKSHTPSNNTVSKKNSDLLEDGWDWFDDDYCTDNHLSHLESMSLEEIWEIKADTKFQESTIMSHLCRKYPYAISSMLSGYSFSHVDLCEEIFEQLKTV